MSSNHLSAWRFFNVYLLNKLMYWNWTKLSSQVLLLSIPFYLNIFLFLLHDSYNSDKKTLFHIFIHYLNNVPSTQTDRKYILEYPGSLQNAANEKNHLLMKKQCFLNLIGLDYHKKSDSGEKRVVERTTNLYRREPCLTIVMSMHIAARTDRHVSSRSPLKSAVHTHL